MLNNLAHYAALAGNLTLLKWIKKFDEKLLWKANFLCLYPVQHGLHKSIMKWFIKHYFEGSYHGFNLNLNTTFTDIATESINLAANAGRISVLIWLKKHNLDAFKSIDNYKLTVSAAASGKTALLDWVKLSFPFGLTQCRHYNGALVHSAAGSGSLAALDWVKLHFPECFEYIDTNYIRILEGIFFSKNPAIVDWFLKKHPLFVINVISNLTSFAIGSNHLAQLGKVLALTNPSVIQSKHLMQGGEETLILKYLKNDYQITKLTLNFPLGLNNHHDTFNPFIVRNIRIQKAKLALLTLRQGRRQQNSILSLLLPEFEFLILKALLPEDIDCQRVYESLMPKRLAIFAIEDEIRMSIRDKNSDMINFYMDFLPILHSGDHQKINIALDKWEENNQDLPKYNAFMFFNHALSSRKCLTLIKTITGCSASALKPEINQNNLLWKAVMFGVVISILSFFIAVAFAAALTGGAGFLIAFTAAFKTFTFATAFGIGAGIYSGLIGFSLYHIEHSDTEEIENTPQFQI